MVASAEAILNGASATMILVTGYLITIRLLFAIRKSESKLLPWQALFAFALGSFYLGTVASFINLTAINFVNLNYRLVGILCYSVTPLGIAAAMYIGFSMIKPNLAKPMAWIFGLSGIPFWANLWFSWPENGISFANTGLSGPMGEYIPTIDLIDIELLSLSEIFTIVYILAMIAILGVGFMILARRSTGEIRTRSRNYAIGLILFGVAGAIDSRGIFTGTPMVAVRVLMVVAYIFLYLAMVPPKASFPPSKSK